MLFIKGAMRAGEGGSVSLSSLPGQRQQRNSEMGRLRRMIANLRGRDLAVGDIHGHFQRLQQCLDAVGFDPAVDRLFSVGDLVDRARQRSGPGVAGQALVSCRARQS